MVSLLFLNIPFYCNYKYVYKILDKHLSPHVIPFSMVLNKNKNAYISPSCPSKNALCASTGFKELVNAYKLVSINRKFLCSNYILYNNI